MDLDATNKPVIAPMLEKSNFFLAITATLADFVYSMMETKGDLALDELLTSQAAGRLPYERDFAEVPPAYSLCSSRCFAMLLLWLRAGGIPLRDFKYN